MTDGRDRTVLAIHPGALGDVILFGQFLTALGGHVRLVAGGEKARLLAGMGVVAEALDFESLPMEEVFSDSPAGRCRLGRALGRCDLLVSCLAEGDAKAQRRLRELTGAPEALFLPVRPPAGHAGHLVDLWAVMAGIRRVPPPLWSVPQAWRRRAEEVLASAGAEAPAGAGLVLIHPGSGSRRKCWPLELFGRLAGRCCPRSSRGPAAVFVVGPVEREWWGGEVIESLRRSAGVVECPPLDVLAGLVHMATAYVGNDSGPTHLAAAVGTPTVALFGPSRPEHFAPRGPKVTVIAADRMEDIRLSSVEQALTLSCRQADRRAGGPRPLDTPEPGR